MSRRDKRYGREVFNQFFLRENYFDDVAFEKAIEERLQNPYWDYGSDKKARIRIIRNKHGARVIANRAE